MGPGATGGSGGPGGKIMDLGALNLAEIYENWQETINGDTPGAGGGGGSGLGQDAKGGEGGGGGSAILSFLDWEHLKRIGIHRARVRVGKGGKEGSDGQPSGFDLVDDQDNVIISMNAPGGVKGGNLSRPAEKQTDAHHVEVEEEPKILCSIVGNSMEIRDGLLFLLGGGWVQYVCPHTPYQAVWPLGLQVVLLGVPPGGSLSLSVTIIDPEGKENCVSNITFVRGYTGRLPVSLGILPLAVCINMPGVWRVSVSSSSVELTSIPIEVIVTQSISEATPQDSEMAMPNSANAADAKSRAAD